MDSIEILKTPNQVKAYIDALLDARTEVMFRDINSLLAKNEIVRNSPELIFLIIFGLVNKKYFIPFDSSHLLQIDDTMYYFIRAGQFLPYTNEKETIGQTFGIDYLVKKIITAFAFGKEVALIMKPHE